MPTPPNKPAQPSSFLTKEALDAMSMDAGDSRYNEAWDEALAFAKTAPSVATGVSSTRLQIITVPYKSGNKPVPIHFVSKGEEFGLHPADLQKFCAVAGLKLTDTSIHIDESRSKVKALSDFHFPDTGLLSNTAGSPYSRWISNNQYELGGRKGFALQGIDWEDYQSIIHHRMITQTDDHYLQQLFTPELPPASDEHFISQLLRTYRNMKGTSKNRIDNAFLAEKSGINSDHLKMIMKGDKLPTEEQLEHLGKLLSIPLQTLDAAKANLQVQLMPPTSKVNDVEAQSKGVKTVETTSGAELFMDSKLRESLANLKAKYNKNSPDGKARDGNNR